MNLKSEWNRLVKSTELDHAFMRHEWFEAWIKNLMTEGKLAIHTAWDNDKLMAIAPLQITRQVRKRFPLEILSFLRSSVTPRSNFIIDNAINPKPFFDSVFSTKGWRIAELKALELNKSMTRKLVAYLKKHKQFVIEQGLQSPYEIIECDWDTYYKQRPNMFRSNFRASRNRAKKAGSIEIIRIEDYETFLLYLDAMVDISSKSWKSDVDTDLQTMPEMASFFKDFCALTSEEGLFLSNVLVLDGKPVAFEFYLKFKNRLVALRWEHDQDYGYYMPGTLLHNTLIKDILDSGRALEFDCSGMPTKYKTQIANDIRQHIDITVGAPGISSKAIMYLKKRFMKSENIADSIS
jgi:CelD/BcsL family acetyltransferase involved in cellulose biosynthesis